MSSPVQSAKSGWIVQKFGGTSIGKFPEKITDSIIKPYSDEYQVAVVCSARSSHTKSEGTTSRLLRAVQLALDSNEINRGASSASLAVSDSDSDDSRFIDVVKLVLEDHVAAAESHIRSPELRSALQADISRECDSVIQLLNASRIIGEVSTRTSDAIMAVGEKLSCRFLAALLNDRGVPAQYVDVSTVIPIGYEIPSSTGLDARFYRHLSARLAEEVYKCAGKVPIITGYFGTVPGGLLENVGRGYTDLCAALVAVGLGADELQVWKEVDGIFTADPRKVPNARLIPSVTPEEAAELTYYGSEVIHPFTMEQVIQAQIPIRIKNVDNPLGDGTVIYPDNIGRRGEATPPHPPSTLSSSYLNLAAVKQKQKSPTAVTTKHGIIVLNVHSNKKSLSHGFLANIFSILDKYQLVVDLISTSEVHVSMALHAGSESKKSIARAIEELRLNGSVDVVRNLAIISLVGKEMKSLVGIAGHMFSTLAAAGVNIEMISQGANEINISCVINESDSLKALQAIHQKLLIEKAFPAPPALDARLSSLKLEL